MGRVSGRLSGAWPTRERYISPTRPGTGRPSGGRHDDSGYFRTPPCAQISTIPASASLGARYDRFLLRVRPASHPGTSIPVIIQDLWTAQPDIAIAYLIQDLWIEAVPRPFWGAASGM